MTYLGCLIVRTTHSSLSDINTHITVSVVAIEVTQNYLLGILTMLS